MVGFISFSVSKSTPRRAVTPGLKLSSTTSETRARSANTRRPSGARRLRVTPFLLRLKVM